MVELRKNKNPDRKQKSASRSNQEQGMDKATNRQKRVGGQLISVGVETGEDAGRKPLIKKGVILTRKKVYRPVNDALPISVVHRPSHHKRERYLPGRLQRSTQMITM